MAAVTLQSLIERVVQDASEAEAAIRHATGHVARAKAKRKYRHKQLLPGFPVAVPCPGPDEARAYFAQPKLTCLLCGKAYRLLPNHLRDTHGVEPDEYRAAYRLPWTFGLAGAEVAQAKSKALKKRLADPKFAAVWFSNADRARDKAHEYAKSQRDQAFRQEINRRRLKQAGRGPWEDADYLGLLAAMKERDLVLRQVAGKLPGVPSYFMAVKWFNSTPARRRLLTEAVHQLSPHNQAKARMLSPAVVERIRELKGEGRIQREIAEEIGLCVMTVAKYLRR